MKTPEERARDLIDDMGLSGLPFDAAECIAAEIRSAVREALRVVYGAAEQDDAFDMLMDSEDPVGAVADVIRMSNRGLQEHAVREAVRRCRDAVNDVLDLYEDSGQSYDHVGSFVGHSRESIRAAFPECFEEES